MPTEYKGRPIKLSVVKEGEGIHKDQERRRRRRHGEAQAR